MLAIFCVIAVAAMVAVIIYFKPPNSEAITLNKDQPSTHNTSMTGVKKGDITPNHHDADVKAISPLKKPLPQPPSPPSEDNKSAKVWTDYVQNLVDAKFITEKERRDQILSVLKKHGDNPEIASYCIRVLAMRASIESTDQLIPYLKDRNSEIQQDTIDALVNHIVDFSINLNNPTINEVDKRQYRERIDQINAELNALYYSPLSDSTTKQLIETRYAYANPSRSDIINMTNSIVQGRTLNQSGVLFIQQVLFTPNAPYQDIINTVKSLPLSEQKRVAMGIQEQLTLEEPDEINIPQDQLNQIKNFIESSKRSST